MFSILRYPLFLSLVVDFAVAFDLFWSNGSSSFYVGNETAYVSWSREQNDPSSDIVLYVTDQDLSRVVSGPYSLQDGFGPEDRLSGNLSIGIPQHVGNFFVSANLDVGNKGPSRLLATLFFTVSNGTNSIDLTSESTAQTAQTVEPTSTPSNNPTLNTSVVGSTIPPSASPPSATPSPVADLSAGPNKSIIIIIGGVVGGFLVLVLPSFLFIMFRRRRRRIESQKALQVLPSPNYLPTSEMVNAPQDRSIKPSRKPPAVRSPPPRNTDGNRMATDTDQLTVLRREDDLISTSHGSTAPPAYTSRAQSIITYIVPRIFRRYSM